MTNFAPFKKISLAPPDPILNLMVEYLNDPRPNKVNLGVGVYRTEELKPYVMTCVRAAEKRLLDENLNKEYLPIQGNKEFIEEIVPLVVGDAFPHERLFAIQSVGGTGALKLGAEFLVEHFSDSTIYLPKQTWDNHRRIFQRAGVLPKEYSYYLQTIGAVDFIALKEEVSKMAPGNVILLHACCHNPTGCDLEPWQQKEIIELIKQKELIAFFDMAYQGFGDGLNEDASFLRNALKEDIPCMIAVSFSKNFGLYGERIGAFMIACSSGKEAQIVGSQIKQEVRGIYSSPPINGARIIAKILQTQELEKVWKEELEKMRMRLVKVRNRFAEALKKQEFSQSNSVRNQKGMFAFISFSPQAVGFLKNEHAIHMSKEGRMSLSGMNDLNIDRVALALKEAAQLFPLKSI